MNSNDDRYIMKLKALYYYYVSKRTQTETAKLLGISRVTLNKLFKEAWSEGMINIEIVDNRHVADLIRLEDNIRSLYGLDNVQVMDCATSERGLVMHRIAKNAAKYVDSLLENDMSIGVAWGNTLETMVNFLPENHTVRNLKFYTLMGSEGIYTPHAQPNIIIQSFINKIGGEGYMINAPLICQTKNLCDTLKQDNHIKKVLEESVKSDIILLSTGAYPDASGIDAGPLHYSAEIIREMQSLNAVGDICGTFFDINGNIISSSISDRLLAINISKLKERRRVICIGGGKHKVRSIIGALNGGYISELFTDKFTAEQILALAHNNFIN